MVLSNYYCLYPVGMEEVSLHSFIHSFIHEVLFPSEEKRALSVNELKVAISFDKKEEENDKHQRAAQFFNTYIDALESSKKG